MSLKEYRRKRNFRRTPEPEGKAGATRGAPRFVVHKHAATRLHFDLRLELGGAFRSWAVPKGPSLNPLDQRLALRVEDHPIAYGDFEGVIPKGNYGAGTVMIWDEGTFEPRDGVSDDKAMLAALDEGRLTVVFHGKKLSGEFALVRLKRAREQNAWLLLKKRDASAHFRIYEPDDVSARSGRTMAQIAAGKGAVWHSNRGKEKAQPAVEAKKPGAKAKRGALPRGLRPMRAVADVRFTGEGEWLYERADAGIRAIAEVENGKAQLFSRARVPLSGRYAGIIRALGTIFRDAVVDGEVVSGTEPTFVVSDLLYRDGKDLRAVPLVERRRLLEKVAFRGPVRLARAEASWNAATAWAGKDGFRTLVAKKGDSAYGGSFSRDWRRVRVGSDTRPPLTNPQKLYWPKEKITKGDLLKYYETVAPTILPYLVDRPQSMHRQPDGVRNDGFFHKDNVGYLPSRVKTVKVESRSAGKTVNYLLIQDTWSLLFVVNLGCIELNPWLSRVGRLDKPDWAIIDLDPDDNDFEEVIDVALEMRDVLRSLGTDGWVKTSGATGLHIFLPVGAKYEYDDVRLFVENLCRVVHARRPGNTSLERNPARRRGKIYLDFLQNRRGQTIAAPYCVRPRPGATVATPLDWREVRRGLRPEAFTIATVPERLRKKGDPWRRLDEAPVDLPALSSKLAKLLAKELPEKSDLSSASTAPKSTPRTAWPKGRKKRPVAKRRSRRAKEVPSRPARPASRKRRRTTR